MCAPGRVLGQPFAERVVDRQLAFGFQLQQDHRGEGLGVAADLPQRAGGYRRPAGVPGRAGGQVDGRGGAGEGDPQRDRGDVLGLPPGGQVVAEVLAQRRLQRGAASAGRAGRGAGRAAGQDPGRAQQGAAGHGGQRVPGSFSHLVRFREQHDVMRNRQQPLEKPQPAAQRLIETSSHLDGVDLVHGFLLVGAYECHIHDTGT